MPLDALDKQALERLDALLEKAAARAGSKALRSSGLQFAKAALEMPLDAEFRTQILIHLRQVAILLAMAPDREGTLVAQQALQARQAQPSQEAQQTLHVEPTD